MRRLEETRCRSRRCVRVELIGTQGRPTRGDRYAGTGVNAFSFNAGPIFKGNKLYLTNMSATDGGVNSKVSVLQAPFPGLPLD